MQHKHLRTRLWRRMLPHSPPAAAHGGSRLCRLILAACAMPPQPAVYALARCRLATHMSIYTSHTNCRQQVTLPRRRNRPGRRGVPRMAAPCNKRVLATILARTNAWRCNSINRNALRLRRGARRTWLAIRQCSDNSLRCLAARAALAAIRLFCFPLLLPIRRHRAAPNWRAFPAFLPLAPAHRTALYAPYRHTPRIRTASRCLPSLRAPRAYACRCASARRTCRAGIAPASACAACRHRPVACRALAPFLAPALALRAAFRLFPRHTALVALPSLAPALPVFIAVGRFLFAAPLRARIPFG